MCFIDKGIMCWFDALVALIVSTFIMAVLTYYYKKKNESSKER